MELSNYINDLLYRYDCVIVPNFGGFITNKISATLNTSTHAFCPPTKQIGFNANLKHNDGLLANYIAATEDFSFEEANNFIAKGILIWLTELKQNAIEIGIIGKMTLNAEKQLIFEPNKDTNFLRESFGLSDVIVSEKERYQEKVIPIVTEVEVKEEVKSNTGISSVVKIAAAAAILLTLGLGYQQYDTVQEKNKLIVAQQQNIEKKIQEATFVIDNPLPTINLNVAVAKTSAKQFHIIAGAFGLMENANKKVKQLQQKGYQANVLGTNKWGLTQVSFESFETKQEATRALRKIKQNGFKEAWLLVKKF